MKDSSIHSECQIPITAQPKNVPQNCPGCKIISFFTVTESISPISISNIKARITSSIIVSVSSCGTTNSNSNNDSRSNSIGIVYNFGFALTLIYTLLVKTLNFLRTLYPKEQELKTFHGRIQQMRPY